MRGNTVCVLAAGLSLSLAGLARGAVVNNYIKNYDTLDYAWIDCNDEFFDTQFYSNENVTAYVNMCRPLEDSIYENEEVPHSVKIPPGANIFIKRDIKYTTKYVFFEFQRNNGLDILQEGRAIKVYWDDTVTDQDIYLEVQPDKASRNSTLDFRVIDTFTEGKTSRDRRKVLSSLLLVSYPNSVDMVRGQGIVTQHVWYTLAQLFMYLFCAFTFVLPRNKTVLNGVQLQDYSFFWLSTNLLVEVAMQFFGDKLPTINAITILVLPAILSMVLVQKFRLLKSLDSESVSRATFYMVLLVNYVVFTVFYLRMMWANDKFLQALIYCFFLPVVIRFSFAMMNDYQTFDTLWVPYVASMFLFIRIIQMRESFKGMILRSVRTPQMGEYSERVFGISWTIFLSVPYQIIAIVFSTKYPEDFKRQRNNTYGDREDTGNLSGTRF